MLDYPYLAPELPMELRAPASGGPEHRLPTGPSIVLWLALTLVIVSTALAGYCLLDALAESQKQPESRYVVPDSNPAD